MRIIGGRWRGQRLPFPRAPDLRPTGDRIRETLFNWLQEQVPGACCLDLFAGSGACGLEALSRGAAQVTLVEKNRAVARTLEANIARLGADNARVIRDDVRRWLRRVRDREPRPAYDLVFMDPPFSDNLLLASCHELEASGCLREPAHIYLESDQPVAPEALPEPWRITQQRRAGAVHYYLCLRTPTH